MPVILASRSQARKTMLEQAGLPVTCQAADIDEALVKRTARAEGQSAAGVAGRLSELKALRVAAESPGALVIGADQMLECDGRWFDKPESLAGARDQLLALRGRRHVLTSAAAVVRDDRVVWRGCEQARLTMRAFSDAFLAGYLAALGDEACGTVGAYRIEGPGIQLFSRVEGDHFVILGLPLLGLLECLRGFGELST